MNRPSCRSGRAKRFRFRETSWLWHNMRQKPWMNFPRHRRAWIWVAITALTLASMSRAESGWQHARSYAQPIVQLLTASDGSSELSAASPSTNLRHERRDSRFDIGPWAVLLPVVFVGLIPQLGLLSIGSVLCLGRAPATPARGALFQRPPPAYLL